MKNFVLSVAFVILSVSISSADCGYCDKNSSESSKEMKKEIMNLAKSIFINVILNDLNLSEEQMKQLFELAKKVDRLKPKYYEKMKSILEEQVAWYPKFKEEAMQNTGFSKEVESKTAQAEYEGIKLTKKMGEEIKSFESEAKKILSREQIDILETYIQPKELLGIVLRSAFAAHKPKNKLTEIKIPKKKEDREKSELEEAFEELNEIHKKKYGQDFGNTGRFLALDGVAKEIAKRLHIDYDFDYSSIMMDIESLTEQTRNLFSEINLLNLMNGMNFSIHQLGHILHCAKDVNAESDAKEKLLCHLDNDDWNKIKSCLDEIYQTVQNGSNKLNEKTIEKIASLKDVFAKITKGKQKNRLVDKMKKSKTAVNEIYGILFESQKDVLYTYNPCLIPPKNLKDPVRVGQASGSSGRINLLKRLRNIPEKVWNKEKENIIERIIAGAEKFGGTYKPEEREEIKNMLFETTEKVRAMSDVDFELEKENIVKNLEVLDKAETLKEQIRELTGEEQTVKHKIREFLLSSTIIPLVETRMKQLKEFTIGKPVDLDSISAAETCKDGKCAVRD